MQRWLNKNWYSRKSFGWVLLFPLSALYSLLTWLNRAAWRSGLRKKERVAVPVIVVGNITAGGTGKTPLAMWLVRCLEDLGRKPGVFSRGYGGSAGKGPVEVKRGMDPAVCGDEPLMMAQRLHCPVVIGADRIASARYLAALGCDVLIADDGLQHYRLNRDFEFLVVDGERGFGNRSRLPAGPLRESGSRVETVDCVVLNGPGDAASEFQHAMNMTLEGDVLHRLDESATKRAAAMNGLVHAVAGIGNPERFFRRLEDLGLTILRHPFADHHRYRQQDLEFPDQLPIVMTEKDAVKCRQLDLTNAWYLLVTTDFPENHATQIRGQLEKMLASFTPHSGEQSDG